MLTHPRPAAVGLGAGAEGWLEGPGRGQPRSEERGAGEALYAKQHEGRRQGGEEALCFTHTVSGGAIYTSPSVLGRPRAAPQPAAHPRGMPGARMPVHLNEARTVPAVPQAPEEARMLTGAGGRRDCRDQHSDPGPRGAPLCGKPCGDSTESRCLPQAHVEFRDP